MDEDPNKVEKNTKPNENENPETGSETKKKDIQEWIKVWKEKEQKKKEFRKIKISTMELEGPPTFLKERSFTKAAKTCLPIF